MKLKKLADLIKKNLDLDGFNLTLSEKSITITENSSHRLSPEDVLRLYQDWATRHGKTRPKTVKGERRRGILKALREFPTKDDWHAIFRGIERNDFYFRIMEFDKLYRKEMFYTFYDAGVEEEAPKGSLEEFFEKYANTTKESEDAHRELEDGRIRETDAANGEAALSIPDKDELSPQPQRPSEL